LPTLTLFLFQLMQVHPLLFVDKVGF